MDSQPANQMVESARQGNKAAATQLVEAFYERIYAFLRRLAGNDADAADLTQKTFARVWQGLQSFAGRSSVSSWIHGIAHHTYVDWRRSNGRTESRTDDWWETCPAVELAPDESVARTDLSSALFASVDRLDPQLRDVVHLHYYQNLTLQETAGALCVSASTIKYRLRQALTELQKSFEPERAPTQKIT